MKYIYEEGISRMLYTTRWCWRYNYASRRAVLMPPVLRGDTPFRELTLVPMTTCGTIGKPL